MPTLIFTGEKSADGSVNSNFSGGDKPDGLISVFRFTDNKAPSSGALVGSASGGSIDYSASSIRMSYPADVIGGAVYNYLAVGTTGQSVLYVTFRARFPTAHKSGVKFIKFFGGGSGNLVANTTIQLAWQTNEIQGVFFGDGTTESNDAQNVIKLDGTNPEYIGRSYNNGAVVSTPQSSAFSFVDEDWHDFRIKVKFNSGTTAENEVNDGEYYLEIDGDVYVHATGLFNRHYNNQPLVGANFGDWSQLSDQPFDVEFDDIVLATDSFSGGDTV